MAIGEGRVDHALRDLATWQRLNQINEVVPIGVFNQWISASPSVQEIGAMLILSAGTLSSDASELVESFSGEIPHEHLVRIIDERIRVCYLDSLQIPHNSPRVSRDKCSSFVDFVEKRWNESHVDWGRLAVRHNQFLDLVVEGLADAESHIDQLGLLDLAYDKFSESLSEDYETGVVWRSAQSCKQYLSVFNRRVADRRFVRVAIRLAKYRRQNSEYPERLE